MKFFLWLGAGILLISAAYLLPGTGTDLWPNVNAAGLAAAAFITFLMVAVLRDPIPVPTRITGWFIYAVCFIVIAAGWRTSYRAAHEQTDQMLRSRQMLGHSSLAGMSRPVLLKVLERYYGTGEDSLATGPALRTVSLRSVFLERFPGAEQGTDLGTILRGEDSGKPLHMYVRSLEDTAIVLTGVGYVPGVNPIFPNYNGQTGRIQETVTVTAKGLAYVLEN